MTLGNRLRMARKAKGLTLKDVQGDTDISFSFLSDIERGRTNPSLDTLRKLSAYYGVAISELMNEPDATPQETPVAAPQAGGEAEPDWANAPEWANWWAIDQNGFAFWYGNKPAKGSYCWLPIDRHTTRDEHPIPDWRTTLRARPATGEVSE